MADNTPPTPVRSSLPFRVVLRLALTTPFAVLRGVLSRANAKRSWKRAIHFSQLRHVSRIITDAGLGPTRALLGHTTGANYRAWVKSKGLTELSDDIGEEAIVHWIGSSNSGKVLLYFHGGGFSIPIQLTTYDMLFAFKADIESTVGDIGICVLEYSLAPEAGFPIQLRQANAALIYLLSKGVLPANIALFGDSAGGNLILQLASHILHPLPAISPPPKLQSPFRGAYLMSPWVALHDGSSSFKRNAECDILCPDMYRMFASQLRLEAIPELLNWVRPATTSDNWWNGLEGIIPNMLITKGECECLLDEVTEIADKLEPHVGQIKVFTEDNGVHEDIIMAFAAGAGRAAPGYPVVIGWLKSVFA